MDYTLAEYNAEKFESLSAKGAAEKLVNNMGYPKELLDVEYDHTYFIRGLVVDKARGNIIKLDRHKYCKRALHGFKMLSKEERSTLYDAATLKGAQYTEPEYAVLDTIFSLPDAFLLCSVISHKDNNPGSITQDYREIYDDVRKAVDMCHRDGYIKSKVAENPKEYIERDERTITMLKRFRKSGRKVFLLTNSLYDYTDTVMKYLYAGSDAPDEEASKWTELFDVIIAGSCKPAFMLDTRRQLYRVDPQNNYCLYNTEDFYTSEFRNKPADYLKSGKTFQGGNFTHLHDLLDVKSGTSVLYVGDHMFSDVLKAKRTLGWRTMLIVPELEHEINTLRHPETVAAGEELDKLRTSRDMLDERIDFLHLKISDEETAESSSGDSAMKLEAIKKESAHLRTEISEKDEVYHKKFHPVWGQLLKTGQQNSRFAAQVESYACLYSSSVANLALLSPEMYYRAMPDIMVHDRLSCNPVHRLLKRRRQE